MKKGHLIVIEGTDCSGKQTQAELLIRRLKEKNVKCAHFSFPRYDTPTGKIIGGPFLDKAHIGQSYFQQGASNVDPMVACLYYAADRRYNIGEINEHLKNGYIVILDRYTESNMAYQTSHMGTKAEREAMWKFIETLEYDLLKLPRPDLTLLLHMPYDYAVQLKNGRAEVADQYERDKQHLINAEQSYLQLSQRNKWEYLSCIKNNKIKSIIEINDEMYKIITDFIANKK